MRGISSNANTIDSRHINTRIRELEEWEALEGADEDLTPDEMEPDYLLAMEELDHLHDLRDEVKACDIDWNDGVTLIRSDHFERWVKYTFELRDETAWLYTHVDWAGAAEELKADFASVNYNRIEYLVRG